METNRRRFCQLLGSALVLPSLLPVSALAGIDAATIKPLFASAAKDRSGDYHLYVMSELGEVIFDHLLPGRAHHTEAHPTQSLLACTARRPGRFIDIIDYQQQRLVKRILADDGRHFFGHSIFSEDGRWLITTENDISTAQGRVVVRSMADDYRVIADYPSHGIGPHELVQQPNSSVLVVANGGILTRPDRGREKLNLDSMQPSLVRLDLNTGERLEQQMLPTEQHQLSIRHIDTNRQGSTVIALQYQGDIGHNPPLVAVHQPHQPLQLLQAPEPINMAMKGYCGSARYDHSGRFAAISAPRGDLISFWDIQEQQFISSIKSRDGCGLTATANTAEFIISAGTGRCLKHNIQTGKTQRMPQTLKTAWDNHLATV
ncbi:DUF1513 domain-containing protein [Amphritea sp. 1_MG-2023]|uniref:DUF1513 domain-containing protein n=1 Tax=Amphritea sp. 1_MG-2023 TaxID=3062670 RepID=UPI0026E3E73F|nr:DUF1513 domain-containing protein [Amphritea sp. 1_MG-2023]MDO6562329.1 DUF1513 domain-containing protein [Amphritea sp. 1_MG-2023]